MAAIIPSQPASDSRLRDATSFSQNKPSRTEAGLGGRFFFGGVDESQKASHDSDGIASARQIKGFGECVGELVVPVEPTTITLGGIAQKPVFHRYLRQNHGVFAHSTLPLKSDSNPVETYSNRFGGWSISPNRVPNMSPTNPTPEAA